MRRTFNEDAPLPPHGQAPVIPDRAPCRWCNDQTPRAILSIYGRCSNCFAAYCNDPSYRTAEYRRGHVE